MRKPELDRDWVCRRMAQGIREAKEALAQAEKDCSDYIDQEIYRQMEVLREEFDDEEEYRHARHLFLQEAAREKGKLYAPLLPRSPR